MEKKYLVTNKKHFTDLNGMRLAKQFCDLTIKVKDGEFQAHKVVLATNLKYFKSMLLNEGQENHQSVIIMDNLDKTYLELILTYAYTGQLLLTESNVYGLIEVSNHLNESHIKEECIDFLEKHLGKIYDCPAIHSFMIVGVAEEKLKMQFYNFKTHAWSEPCEIMDLKQIQIDKWAMFRNKFYYTVYKINQSNKTITNLQVFDPSTKQNRMLASATSLLRDSAMCVCTEMLYFCGGRPTDGNGASDQVLRYDLRSNQGKNHFETLPPMRKKRAGAAAIFYQGHVLVLGGYDEDQEILNSVEKYDPKEKKWLKFPSMQTRRDYLKVALLDGKLYACGGRWNKSVEVYDPLVNDWHRVTNIIGDTADPVIIGYEDKILHIVNDGNQTFRVYDPSKNRWLVDQKMSSGLQLHNFGGGLVPSSCVLCVN